jgi:hypothetical protein
VRLTSGFLGHYFKGLLKLEPLHHFLNENKIKLKLKTLSEFEGILGVVGKPSMSQI